MNRRRHTTTFGIAVAIVSAIAFAIYGALEGLLRARGEPGLGQFVASFACLGFLVGAILAFESQPDSRAPDRPALRTALGAIAGFCLALVWQWPFEGFGLSVLVSAALGYLGMTWAKYI